MGRLQALIFDVDGTLADTERDGHRVAFNRAFAAAGLDWHWSPELYGELLAVSGGKERMRHYIRRYSPAGCSAADPTGMVAALHADKNRHYDHLLAEGRISLRPGVRRLLDEARHEGLRLAIATTTTRSNLMGLLRHALSDDACSWFEVIATADEVTKKKPAPHVYHYTLDALGLAASQCIAFEDSENGLRASLAAGLDTIVTVNDYTCQGEYDGAALVVDHLGDPRQAFRLLGGVLAGRVPEGQRCIDVSLLRHLWP